MAVRRPSARAMDETVLRYAAGIMVGFLVVGTALVVASVVVDRSPDRSAVPTRRPSAPASASADAPSSAAATPSATADPAPRMTAAAMTGFVRDYLATAPRDPSAAWRRLTGGFQSASGGFSSYQGFWGPVATATGFGFFAQPRARRITYRVRYTYPDRPASVDSTRLELVLTAAGRYRIAGEG